MCSVHLVATIVVSKIPPHHKLPIPWFGNGNCAKKKFHGFIHFAHGCHAFKTQMMHI
jgi:hypothetical protein